MKPSNKIAALAVSAGVIFSWSIQLIENLNVVGRSYLQLLPEECARILLSGIAGAIVFYSLFRLFARVKNRHKKEVLLASLTHFHIFILFLFLEGRSFGLFFFLVSIIVVISFIRLYYFNFCKSLIDSIDLKNAFISVALISWFSIFPIFYSGDFSAFVIIKTFVSLSFLIIPVFLLSKGIRIYLFLIILMLSVYAIPPLFHIYKFGSKMPSSVYYVIKESPRQEMLEYVSSYFDFKTGIFILLFLSLPMSLLFFVQKVKSTYFIRVVENGGIVNIVLLLTFSFANSNYKNNILYGYYQNFSKYEADMSVLNQNLARRKAQKIVFINLKDLNPKTEQPVFVLIIGESTGRNHMGLYGYYRNTNPQLKSIQNELVVFKDVISPHSHTTKSLQKILTFANFENMDPLYKEGNVVELFKQAGYRTYWLSNQYFLGQHETFSTSIAKTADHYVFTNDPELNNNKDSYDEQLLSPLKKTLAEKNGKKFIIIHLMGTHGGYAQRYPTSFNYFNGGGRRSTGNSYEQDRINEYDNAVRYNDSLIYEIIHMVKATSSYSYVIYFSDHGEEVYDSRPYYSHQESNATPFMFEIPFLVWFSDNYKKVNKLKVDSLPYWTNRKYQTDHVIHSVIDLSNLELMNYQPEKSVFNLKFKENIRVMNNQNYDSIRKSYKIFSDRLQSRH